MWSPTDVSIHSIVLRENSIRSHQSVFGCRSCVWWRSETSLGCVCGGETWWKWINRIVFTGCSRGGEGASRVGTTTTTKRKYLFSVPQVPAHRLLVFLDDSFTLNRAIYVPLSLVSLQRRGLKWLAYFSRVLWSRLVVTLIEQFLKKKKKKKKGQCHDWSNSVCRVLKIGFVWLEGSHVFIYTSDCFKWQLALCTCVWASVCTSMHIRRVRSPTYRPAAWEITARRDRREEASATVSAARLLSFLVAGRPCCPPHPLLTTFIHTSLQSSLHLCQTHSCTPSCAAAENGYSSLCALQINSPVKQHWLNSDLSS